MDWNQTYQSLMHGLIIIMYTTYSILIKYATLWLIMYSVHYLVTLGFFFWKLHKSTEIRWSTLPTANTKLKTINCCTSHKKGNAHHINKWRSHLIHKWRGIPKVGAIAFRSVTDVSKKCSCMASATPSLRVSKPCVGVFSTKLFQNTNSLKFPITWVIL